MKLHEALDETSTASAKEIGFIERRFNSLYLTSTGERVLPRDEYKLMGYNWKPHKSLIERIYCG